MNKFIGGVAIMCLGIACVVAMTSDIFVGCIAMILFGIFALAIGACCE